MRHWLLTAGLAIGPVFLFGCEKQAEQKAIELVDDSPVLGVWFLQSAGERPVAIDSTIRFEFKPHGQAIYERTTGGPEEPDRYELTYNLTGAIISIDGDSEEPGVPRFTGKIEFDNDGNTLRISTHTDEDWLLTRAKLPGGALEDARRMPQNVDRTDPRMTNVQRLAYACSTFVGKEKRTPNDIMDLVTAGLVRPEDLLASGKVEDLPARFDRMTPQQQGDWLKTHGDYLFFFRYAGTGQASSVVVTTVPLNSQSTVFVGMANGAVYLKPAREATQLLQFQLGKLPERWPESERTRDATAGLEPLSD